ncbi:MAG: PEP-utilizing enzyme [Patescibacteria group bacterium]
MTTKEKLEKLDIFNTNVWLEDGRWIQAPLQWMLFTYWHTSDILKRAMPGVEITTIFSIDGYAFHSTHSRKAIYDYLKNSYEAGTLLDYVSRIDAEGDAVFKKVEQNFLLDDETFIKNFDSVIKTYKEFIGLWTIATFAGDEMTKIAKDTGYVTADADLFGRVQPFLRDTWIEEEVHAIRDIAEKYIKRYPNQENSIAAAVENDKELSGLVDSYIQHYIWSRISKWVGEPVDRAHAYKRLSEEITNILKGNNVKAHRKAISDPGYDGVVALCSSSAYWRAQAAMLDMKMAHRMRPILDDIGSKNGVGYKLVLMLTPNELFVVLRDSKREIKNKETVFSREKVFFNALSLDGEEIVLTPNDPLYAEIDNLYLKRHYEQTGRLDVLKGIGASKGYVKGIVRVIESQKQFADFKDGEILVAAETSPTFVPLMRASSAILTGKGGITSHAAIVSRELGKPCIIAIKDVTRILQTGDRVEVDANAGIVRII